MSLRDAQQTVDRWIGQYKEGYFSPLTNLARLTEEVGELAREINHRFGEKTKKKELRQVLNIVWDPMKSFRRAWLCSMENWKGNSLRFPSKLISDRRKLT